jgi:hypothetical protein
VARGRRAPGRSGLTAAVALVAAALAFLRLPLDGVPDRSHGPVGPPRASAIESSREVTQLPAPLVLPVVMRSDRERPAPFAPALVPAPYRFFGREDLRLHAAPGCAIDPDGPVCAGAARLDEAIRSRVAVLEGFPGDADAPELLLLLGASYQAVADYERAAEYYEAYAWHPSERASERAADALENAVLFRRALGQLDRARTDARRHRDLHARDATQAAARVSLNAGALEETPAAAAAHYGTHLRIFGASLSPGETIRAELRLGRAYHEAGDGARAARALRAADRLWSLSGGRLERDTATAAERDVELAQVRDAVAEARFLLAEQRFERFRAVAPPRFGGPATHVELDRFLAREVVPWVLRKTRLLRAAERAYRRVGALGAGPWAVAAHARSGQMLRQLNDDFRRLDLPATVATGDERITEVETPEIAFRTLSGPAVQRFELCLEAAERDRLYGRWSELCAEALERLDPGRHPPTAEMFRRELQVRDEIVAPRAYYRP